MEIQTLSKKRVQYWDTVRLLAAVYIFTTHFISALFPEMLVLWKYFPIKGITGKLATTIFCVLVGYFASIKGSKGDSSWQYIFDRYAFFVFAGFTTFIIYMPLNYINGVTFSEQIEHPFLILQNVLLIKPQVASIWWCMMPFFISSCLCFINGKYNIRPSELLVEIFVFICVRQTWIACCLMGSMMWKLLQSEKTLVFLQKSRVRLCIAIMTLFLIQMDERHGEITYLLDSICMTGALLLIETSSAAKNFLEASVWLKVNRYYMGVFIIHPVVYNLLGDIILKNVTGMSRYINGALLYIICLFVTLLLAKILMNYLNFGHKMIRQTLNTIYIRARSHMSNLMRH